MCCRLRGWCSTTARFFVDIFLDLLSTKITLSFFVRPRDAASLHGYPFLHCHTHIEYCFLSFALGNTLRFFLFYHYEVYICPALRSVEAKQRSEEDRRAQLRQLRAASTSVCKCLWRARGGSTVETMPPTWLGEGSPNVCRRLIRRR